MKKAFTLVEMLVVLAIVAILAAMVIGHMVDAGKGKKIPVQLPTSTNLLEKVAPPASAGYDVQLLFMIDGMKVYRFYDNGRYIYVVDGRNSKTGWVEMTPAGKTVISVPQEVQTVK